MKRLPPTINSLDDKMNFIKKIPKQEMKSAVVETKDKKMIQKDTRSGKRKGGEKDTRSGKRKGGEKDTRSGKRKGGEKERKKKKIRLDPIFLELSESESDGEELQNLRKKSKKKLKRTEDSRSVKIEDKSNEEEIIYKTKKFINKERYCKINLEKFRNEYRVLGSYTLNQKFSDINIVLIYKMKNTNKIMIIQSSGDLIFIGMCDAEEAAKVYNDLQPLLESCVVRKESVEEEVDDEENVPGTPSLKSVQKESVEDENKENIPPDDTKIPEREIKITSC